MLAVHYCIKICILQSVTKYIIPNFAVLFIFDLKKALNFILTHHIGFEMIPQNLYLFHQFYTEAIVP